MTALFPRVLTITIVALVVLVTLRGTNGSKTWDQAAFACSVLGAAYLTFRFLRGPTMTPSRIALVVALGGLLCGIARVERPMLTAVFWEGFGTSVALLSVLLAVTLLPVTAWVRRSRLLTWTLTAVAAAVFVNVALSLFRDTGDFEMASNNTFVLNEVLAPAAGRVPGSNFVPQYTTLYGWVLVPFRDLLSADQLANVATVGLSLLGIASVALAILLSWRSLPPRSLWTAALLAAPVAGLTVLHGAITSSIGSFMQELPLRMFPAMLCSVVAVYVVIGLLQGELRRWALVTLGILAGLMVWNSQDVGVVVAVTSGVILQIAARGRRRRTATVLWILGLVPSFLVYPVATLAAGHPIKLSYFALTARSFRDGFGSSPIQMPGPVLVVMPVVLGAAVVGVCLLWKASTDVTGYLGHERFAVATLAFVGLWAAGSFPYYVNRSYASGQLQVFLLPFAVCCCALLSLCGKVVPVADDRLIRSIAGSFRSGALWLMPVTLATAVGLSALLQSPDPSVAWDALVHSPGSIGFGPSLEEANPPSPAVAGKKNPPKPDYHSVRREVVRVQAYARHHGGGTVGYFGPNANYLALATGVAPRILYDDPADFSLSVTARRYGCEFLLDHATSWLVTAPGTTAFLGPTICGTYDGVPVPGNLAGTVFKLAKS